MTTFAVAYPELPLAVAREMRNALAFGYFKVDLGIVWRTIKRDLPRLLRQHTGQGQPFHGDAAWRFGAPAARTARTSAAQDAAVAPPPAAVPGEHRARIVLADDNTDMRRYLASLLAPRGRVEVVSNWIACRPRGPCVPCRTCRPCPYWP